MSSGISNAPTPRRTVRSKRPEPSPQESSSRLSGATASAIFVPPKFAGNAILEGVDAGLDLVVAITEGIVDFAAEVVGMDPAAFRKRNLAPDDAYPRTYLSGATFEKLSQHESLELLIKTMGYDALRTEQAALREKGVYRGIGLAMFIENSMSSSATAFHAPSK